MKVEIKENIMKDLEKNKRNMRIMRIVINPANWLWTKKGQQVEFADHFFKIFEGKEYETVLIADFDNLIDEYAKYYTEQYYNITLDINSSEIEDENLHQTLKSLHNIDFPAAFRAIKEYQEKAKEIIEFSEEEKALLSE